MLSFKANAGIGSVRAARGKDAGSVELKATRGWCGLRYYSYEAVGSCPSIESDRPQQADSEGRHAALASVRTFVGPRGVRQEHPHGGVGHSISGLGRVGKPWTGGK